MLKICSSKVHPFYKNMHQANILPSRTLSVFKKTFLDSHESTLNSIQEQETKNKIISILYAKTTHLMANNFYNAVGAQGRTITSPISIDTTPALLSFVHTSPAFFGKKFIPVYVNANSEELRTTSLGEIVASVLKKADVSVEPPSGFCGWSTQIANALDQTDRRMALIVDKFHTLYTKAVPKQALNDSLNLCIDFSNSRRGRVFIVCVGPTELPSLMDIKDVEILKDRYPRNQEGRPMNITKFHLDHFE